jgi:hypothetical protein
VDEKWARVGKIPYGEITAHCGTNQTHIICIGGEPRHGHNDNTDSVVQIAKISYLESTPALSTVLKTDEEGRFSVRRTAAGWTLVKPDGAPTWLTAINHLSSFRCHEEDKPCLVTDLLTNRFRGNWSALAESFVADLKKWGFTSAGYGQAEHGNPGQPTHGGRSGWEMFPYFPSHPPEQGSPDAPGGFALFDVFEESFNSTTDRNFAQLATRVQATGASNAVGYYLEDIPVWKRSQPRGPQKDSGAPAWTGYMRAQNRTSAGKKAYVGWLQTRYGTGGLAELCRAYNVAPPATSWDALLAWPFGGVDVSSEAIVTDDLAFLGVVADRIYGVAASAIRRHDEGALVFGDRFIQTDMPSSVLAAAAKHFDVLTIQPQPFSYNGSAMLQRSVEDAAAVASLYDKPLMIADQATHYPGSNREGAQGARLNPLGLLLNPLGLFLRTSIPFIWRILSSFLHA